MSGPLCHPEPLCDPEPLCQPEPLRHPERSEGSAVALLRHFEVMAGAPNGVQKLRELILQLAVRGKLVPQDASDEPASVLLERIAEEKQRLFMEGKIGKPKRQAPVAEDEMPFEVPEGWEWVRIGEAMNLINGRAFKPMDWSTTGLPIVRIQNLNNAAAPFNYCDFDVSEKFYVDDEDLLLSWSGTPGTSFGAFVWRRGRAVLNQHIFRCELYGGAYLNDFVCLAINGRMDKMIAQAHGGVGLQHVTKRKLDNLLIVLPPRPEQRRIVAKVYELMALCDEFEALQQRRTEARARLNRSALHHLAAATDDAELAAHWDRLQENFHLLYDTPERVAELRQAVLQLAVRGKLVPQEPGDEPASVLLGRIAVEKERLFKQGKIGKQKLLPPVRDHEVPFEVPEGWEWVRFGQVIDLVSGQHLVPTEYNDQGDGLPYLTGPADFGAVSPTASRWTHQRRAVAREGDVLLTVKGAGIGKTNVLEYEEAAISRQLMAIRPLVIERRFADLVARSATEHFRAEQVGIAIPGIGRDDVFRLKVALPPLPEQQRIVAKVDGLLALCDQLQARLTAAREKSMHLAASVVHHLAAA